MIATFQKYTLIFKTPSLTSRERLVTKDTYYIKVYHSHNPQIVGIGEASLFSGLSYDDKPNYEAKLHEVCQNINTINWDDLNQWSSIKFGLETALNDLKNGGNRTIFPTPFTQNSTPIKINGLIWMGDKDTMCARVEEKLKQGFSCIKLKIGGINFESELDILKSIRSRYSKEEIEIRLDANGAFAPQNALSQLNQLSKYDIHSIEQPIRQGNPCEMAKLCADTPIPIALDEELIHPQTEQQKHNLLQHIKPQYIILKPTLVGGFSGADQWIAKAEELNIGWWATSALESNIGLNAIAQWVSTYKINMPQGLGTGALYTNNIPSPLQQVGEKIYYNPQGRWDLSTIK